MGIGQHVEKIVHRYRVFPPTPFSNISWKSGSLKIHQATQSLIVGSSGGHILLVSHCALVSLTQQEKMLAAFGDVETEGLPCNERRQRLRLCNSLEPNVSETLCRDVRLESGIGDNGKW